MRRRLFLCLFLLFMGCTSHEQAFEEILRLEDRRAPAANFVKFLTHSSAAVRRRAVIALGRLQEPEAVPLLTPMLKSSDAATRVEAAFALGQLVPSSNTSLFMRHVVREKDLEVRLALIEAISKAAQDSTFAEVSDQLVIWLKNPIPIVRAEAALAAARLAQRGLKKIEWSAPLANLLGDKAEEVRWRAAYALMRLYSGGQVLADSAATNQLITALHDRSARVRMQAAHALGAIKTPAALEPLAQTARQDADWRVRVNAAAAIGNFDEPGLLMRLAKTDTSEHVRLTALRALGTAAARMLPNGALDDEQAIGKFLQERLSGDEATWREQAAAALVLAQIFHEDALPILSKYVDHPNPLFRSRLAEAFGATATAGAFPHLAKMARDSATIVQIAVLEALPKLPATVQNKVTPFYLEALQRGDAVLTAVAAQNLAADSLHRKSYAAAIVASYQNLQQPVDVEPAQMIFAALARCGDLNARALLERAVQFPDKPFARAAAEALKKLTGEDCSNRIPQETKTQLDFTYQDIRKLRQLHARIKTNRGDVELQFFTEAAPLTVLNFVHLAQRGFFDGLLIHRVVPNFVIQTGDPRGDMWGSPGYSIRSEFSRLRYTRGMVGMASVGPDTEGCQFFITHSDQPHLDGRYTIFARVKSGMEIVDALQVGDRMEQVTILSRAK
ncbi:MAG: HEAT repeat domain-containing protein [candidate division KSB1 bacterium]|nr:HEAT repeat domain-containing protein [candidate division KSB1 bacterium]MDZ7303783.1 HEAT repeat domain-containing protein [candidate division KSB1 bacterium]